MEINYVRKCPKCQKKYTREEALEGHEKAVEKLIAGQGDIEEDD